jgi:chemotaxis protein methyltransferase CheR
VRRGDRALATAVVDAMTTNETSWFRDSTPFEALRERVLPERIAANRERRQLSIWSAACSTGQEPYSIAMLIEQSFPELATWNVSLLGTDLSSAALERARVGRYSNLEINRGLPAANLLQYFTRDGAQFQIAERLRARVRFQPINLAEPWPIIAAQDVILLRNVLIYFDAPTKQKILANVRAHLRPGGYLLLGAAETTRELVGGFVPVPVARSTVYRLEES